MLNYGLHKVVSLHQKGFIDTYAQLLSKKKYCFALSFLFHTGLVPENHSIDAGVFKSVTEKIYNDHINRKKPDKLLPESYMVGNWKFKEETKVFKSWRNINAEIKKLENCIITFNFDKKSSMHSIWFHFVREKAYVFDSDCDPPVKTFDSKQMMVNDLEAWVRLSEEEYGSVNVWVSTFFTSILAKRNYPLDDSFF